MKFLTLFFVTIWISLASGNAFAGTFTLSDRWGGSVSNPITFPFGSLPYREGFQGGYGLGIGGFGTSTASETITSTFEWNPEYPGEPVPESVVVVEYCKADASAIGVPNSPFPVGIVAADNGFGDPMTTPTIMGNSSSIISEGTHYRIVSGDDLINGIECTPSASATGVGGAVHVVYTISVHVPTIDIVGPIVDQDQLRTVTGKQLSADLYGDFPCIVLDKTWSFKTGGIKCFGSFDISEDQRVGKVIGVNLSADTLSFCTKEQGGVVVKCVAFVWFPDGTVDEMVVTSRKVFSTQPDAEWTILSGKVGFDNSNPPTKFGLLGFGSVTRGQKWTAKVTLAEPFEDELGECSFLQLSNSERNYVTTNDPPNYTWPPYPDKGEGLDNSFPYAGITFSPKVDTVAGDSPNTGISDDMISVQMDGNYYTWIMFKPTGGQWVPVSKYDWDWTGTATLTQKSGSVNPMIGTTGSATTTHPSWTKKRTNGPPVKAMP